MVTNEPAEGRLQGFTPCLEQRDGWWVGWIDEVPGVNAQERTRDELIESLASALAEALEMEGVVPRPSGR